MKKLTKEEFIEKAKQVHGDKYDYSKVEYINNRTKYSNLGINYPYKVFENKDELLKEILT